MTTSVFPARARSATALSATRLAGLAGLLFVMVVIGQNMIRFAIAPANDASVDTIVNHYQQDRGLFIALGTSFAVGGFALAMFVAGIASRAVSAEERIWAGVATVGGAAVMVMFAAMVACEFALLVLTDRPTVSEQAVETVFVLHNAVFSALTCIIGIALVGVARTAFNAGLLPRSLAIAAPLGAALLSIGTVAGPQIAAGDFQPLMGVATLGFVVWLTVMATASIGLLRTE
ncbi:MAG: hypothetical protein AB7J35_04655 [Dehalococcoidia bacterium]